MPVEHSADRLLNFALPSIQLRLPYCFEHIVWVLADPHRPSCAVVLSPIFPFGQFFDLIEQILLGRLQLFDRTAVRPMNMIMSMGDDDDVPST